MTRYSLPFSFLRDGAGIGNDYILPRAVHSVRGSAAWRATSRLTHLGSVRRQQAQKRRGMVGSALHTVSRHVLSSTTLRLWRGPALVATVRL